MSHSSRIFEEAPIKVQNRNGFDLSHLNVGTSKCGQLVPVMCKLLPPNSKFTLGVNMEVNLPPLATTFYGRIDAIVEGFVIPLSILYGGFKQFVSNQQMTMFPSSQDDVLSAGGYALPWFDAVAVSGASGDGTADWHKLFEANENVYEYLGVRQDVRSSGIADEVALSLMPAIAYHLVWDTWYRNKQVTKTIFAVNPNWDLIPSASSETSSFTMRKNVSLIWHSFYSSSGYSPIAENPGVSLGAQRTVVSDAQFRTDFDLTFPDGVSVFSTRQRCYARDYFTAASLSTQQGNAPKLQFSIVGTADAQGDVSGGGDFTIAALRTANSLTKFVETNNLSGDYAETNRNRWGVKPIDADFEEPYYLGRVVVPVYQKGVVQSAGTYDSTSEAVVGGNSTNPFTAGGVIGAQSGKAGFSGEGSIVDSFTSTCWSYVMCIFSLVPHAMYGFGLNRELQMLALGDFPAPELQSVGYDDIKCTEVFYNGTSIAYDFGYIPRYSRFKYMDDEVHGEMRPGKTLASFVLQRRLVPDAGTGRIQLSTAFLEIPQNALDSVFATSVASSKLSCWYEIFFSFKVSMPLADFCIPTLGDIQDTHTIHTPVGGSRL